VCTTPRRKVNYPDGTLAAPAVRFSDDLDTGFYRSAANEVTFVAGGVSQFKYNTTGLVFTGAGGGTIANLTTTGNTTLGDAAADTVTINGTPTVNAPTTITVNSATNALRITQTGAGNALLVEDSANPDSTPFVIDTTGRVIIGNTTSIIGPGATSSPLQVHALNAALGTESLFNWANSASSATQVAFNKSKSGVVGTLGSVASADLLGVVSFNGDDGTTFVTAASISALVDGTPGTNDMPGRLVFSTTADGASIPTERMRIDSRGNIGLGGASSIGRNISLLSGLTGSANSSGVYAAQTIQADVTGNADVFASVPATAAAAFTVANLRHFRAFQSTIGAGSAITNQYGFSVESNLIGATTNYGFHSNIASGTGRWNFYAAGTAANYFAGKTSIGTLSDIGQLNVVGTGGIVTGATTTADNAIIRAAEPLATYSTNFKSVSLQYLGTTAAGTNSGIANADLGAVFFTNTANALIQTNGSCPLIFSTASTERMRIDSAGRVGIGGTPNAFGSFFVDRTVSGETSGSAIYAQSLCGSGVTGSFSGVTSRVSTSAATFTVNEVSLFLANPVAKGAGSTINSQFGFNAASTITSATNNYGFISNIASGTGRWNFYAAGSAQNYFEGNVIQKLAASVTPANNSEMMIQLTSNTSLTIKVKGTDGTVRSVSLTLA